MTNNKIQNINFLKFRDYQFGEKLDTYDIKKLCNNHKIKNNCEIANSKHKRIVHIEKNRNFCQLQNQKSLKI